jgi:hypothetical protein
VKDKNSLFDQPTSPEHDAKVHSSVEKILLQNKLNGRRKLFAWLAVPALASFLGFFFIRSTKESESLNQLADFFLIKDEPEEDLELIADLELLEELETLEDWDGSEET